MNQKNTLGSKQKDRGYPEFYTMLTKGAYSKLQAPTLPKASNGLQVMLAKVYMQSVLGALKVKVVV